MVKTIISVDVKKPAWEQDPKTPLHNRWHPDIPAVAMSSAKFRVESAQRGVRVVPTRRWRGGHRTGRARRDVARRAPAAATAVDRKTPRRCIDSRAARSRTTTRGRREERRPVAGPPRRWRVRSPRPAQGRAVEPGRVGLHRDAHKDNGGGFLTDHYPQATKRLLGHRGRSRRATSRRALRD